MSSFPRPAYYIPIHGTWAIDENETAWWKTTGPFAQFARRNAMHQWNKLPPFIWSSDINGIGYTFLAPKTKLVDWLAGGWSLVYYLQNVPEEHRNFIVHSHGLQPLLFCASFGYYIHNVVSVCSPIRNDMEDITVRARPYIHKWLHIYDQADRTQFLGQIGDGNWFGSRASKYADENHKLEKIDHSLILKKDSMMHLWLTQGWFDYLRQ
jgi:hypothetical protein